jgi:hypothetical protein
VAPRSSLFYVAAVAVVVLSTPLAVLLFFAPASQSQCSSGISTPAGPRNAAGVPTNDMPYFDGAAQQENLGPDGWAVLAAINSIESDFDTSTLPGVRSGANAKGAEGPMQFEPGTWQEYMSAVPANLPAGAQPPSVYDEGDAVYAAAAYLKASGAPNDWPGAIFAYNHAGWYVSEVQGLAETYEQDAASSAGTGTDTSTAGTSTTSAAGATTTGGTTTSSTTSNAGGGCGVGIPVPTTNGPTAVIQSNGLAEAPAGAPAAVQQMIAAGNELIHYPYSWAGGHCNAAMTIPPGPSACPGEEENGGEGYDCSGSTSFVVWGGGLGQSVMGDSTADSGEFMSLGQPGAGQWVTWYATTGHVWIIVAGIALDTSHAYDRAATPGGTGPRWVPAKEAEQYELTEGLDHQDYVARHPAGL